MQPRVVTIADNMEAPYLAKTMGQAMHNIHHLVKEIEANPETLLMFEVHVKPKLPDDPPPEGPEQRGPHNGYPLRRKPEEYEGPEDMEMVDDIRWRNYGWSFLPIFDLEDELRAGPWKLPIYKPPANINMDLSNWANELVRIPNTHVWLRLDYPDEP